MNKNILMGGFFLDLEKRIADLEVQVQNQRNKNFQYFTLGFSVASLLVAILRCFI